MKSVKLFMKVSDLEIILEKLKSLNVDHFTLEQANGSEAGSIYASFNFYNNESISFVSGLDHELKGMASITYWDDPNSSDPEELLDEKRTVLTSPFENK